MKIPEEWQVELFANREIPGQGLCAVQRFIFTCGLLTNIKFNGPFYDYKARYCYPSLHDALLDLRTWDGKGDPPGDWIKEKVTGRKKHE